MVDKRRPVEFKMAEEQKQTENGVNSHNDTAETDIKQSEKEMLRTERYEGLSSATRAILQQGKKFLIYSILISPMRFGGFETAQNFVSEGAAPITIFLIMYSDRCQCNLLDSNEIGRE